MKKIGLILVCFIFLTGIAFAQDTKWYLGGGYGVSDVDTGVSGLTGTATLDEDGDGFKFFAGFQFNEYFGFEIAYVDLGEAELKGNNGDTFVLDGVTYNFTADSVIIAAEVDTIALEAVFSLPLQKMTGNESLKYFTPFIKFGVHFWDIEYTVAASNLNAMTADDDGTDIVFGAGINFNIIRNLSIRAEWERFNADEDLDYFSGSIIVRF